MGFHAKSKNALPGATTASFSTPGMSLSVRKLSMQWAEEATENEGCFHEIATTIEGLSLRLAG